MATFRITDPTSGITLKLTGDSAPTEQELEQIFAQQAQPIQQPIQQPAANVPRETQQPQQEAGLRERLNQAILEAPGGTVLAELGSAVSRGAVNLADLFVGKPAQAIAGLAGQEIPTLAQTELGQAATTGGETSRFSPV